MLVYRIVPKKYAHSLFASGMPGRWNSAGNKVIYTSESIPLAFLENMVRRQGVGFNDLFRIMFISLPGDAAIETIDPAVLEWGWRHPNDYGRCQELGDEWYNAGRSLALKVPSAVMPGAFSYVIHAMHSMYSRVELAGVTNLVPCERIEEILKKYT